MDTHKKDMSFKKRTSGNPTVIIFKWQHLKAMVLLQHHPPMAEISGQSFCSQLSMFWRLVPILLVFSFKIHMV